MATVQVTLPDAREERAARQSRVLARFGKPLLSITVVMPGPVKNDRLSRTVMEMAVGEVDRLIGKRRWRILS